MSCKYIFKQYNRYRKLSARTRPVYVLREADGVYCLHFMVFISFLHVHCEWGNRLADLIFLSGPLVTVVVVAL